MEQGSRCAALAVAIDTSDFWQIGSSKSLDTRIASTAPEELKTVQPRLSGPKSSYLSAVLNSFSTKRSILIGAGLEGKSDCLFRAFKQISSISPRSSKYNWKGNGPEGVRTLRTLLFPMRFAQSDDDVFGSQFAALYLFHGRSKRKAQLRV